jgi:uncharacterized membrane protein YeaQ/YmgE (transglycosylase-associated protein family)
MTKILHLLFEAFCVGITVIIFGYIGGYIAKMILPKPGVGINFNKYHVMELSLFIAGALLHLFFEAAGLNQWYCVNKLKG